MIRRGIKYGLLIIGLAFASCHSPAPKSAVQNIPAKKDTVKAVVKTEESIRIPDTNTAAGSYVILDTVVGRDKLKVVLYRVSMIKCTLNRLSDSIAAPDFEEWDYVDYDLVADYRSGDNCPLIVPGKREPVKFILNDTLLLLPIPSTGSVGGTLLFLLNRTKTSLKFAKQSPHNPIMGRPFYMYVDLKNNLILYHGHWQIYNDEEDNGNHREEHGRFEIYRYRIENKHFVETDDAASFLPEFEKLDAEVEELNDSKFFYNTIIKHENWERDRYDSSNLQKIVAVDTCVGEDKLKITYDNTGNVICTLNGKCDTTDLGESWIGYEWWRERKAYRIIVPGEKKPRLFIVSVR